MCSQEKLRVRYVPVVDGESIFLPLGDPVRIIVKDDKGDVAVLEEDSNHMADPAVTCENDPFLRLIILVEEKRRFCPLFLPMETSGKMVTQPGHERGKQHADRYDSNAQGKGITIDNS